ncbi:MAG TPA: hypothetical protein PKE32_09890, partial [Miltoncostaeaceae bacterium]|nr:hypothetical protein [Miltoncostaeaceae bacterium]
GHEIPPPPGDEYAPPSDEYAPAPQEQSPPADAPHLADPPPPSPVTAGDGPFDLDHLERRWPQVLAALQRDAPPVRGFLDDSHPLALDEGGLVIAVTSAVRASMLDNPDNRGKIAEAVHALTGHRPQIAFQASAAPAQANPTAAERAEPPDGDTLLAEFKMMFNATEEGDDQ